MITDHYRIGKHKYYFKVLEEGRRPPHARHADPWPPIGQWTCEKYPSMCSTGYHLTTLRGLPRWAPGLFDLNFAIPDIYVAEIDLGTPRRFSTDDGHYKICVPRARLIRKLPVSKSLRRQVLELQSPLYPYGERHKNWYKALRFLANYWGLKIERGGIFR